MNRLLVYGLIPARGGSKGLARKNIRQIDGTPLIAYTIRAAQNASKIDCVFVSTEDAEIAQISREYGAEVLSRSPVLASDTATSNEVVKDACGQWIENPPDIVVYLQATDIFRRRGIIDACVDCLLCRPEVDAAFAAYPDHKNFWCLVDGKASKLGKFPDLPRQAKPAIFREDTGIACATRFEVARRYGRIGGQAVAIPHPEPFSFIDIHTEEDLWFAETVVKRFKETDRYAF
jgi:CMP-N,N'-diacetyllegionaminic acid synthase